MSSFYFIFNYSNLALEILSLSPLTLTSPVELSKTTKRGGVNQLLLGLNNFKSIKPFLIFHQVTINIIHHMNNINNENQSHIRYTHRHIFTRKPIKGENLFFFEMIGSVLSYVHHLFFRTNSK
jgi:hypothetical protein